MAQNEYEKQKSKNINRIIREAKRKASKNGTAYNQLNPVDQAKVKLMTENLLEEIGSEKIAAIFKDMASIAINSADKSNDVNSEDVFAMVASNFINPKSVEKFKSRNQDHLNAYESMTFMKYIYDSQIAHYYSSLYAESFNSIASSINSCKTVEDVIRTYAEKNYGIKISLENGQYKVIDSTQANIEIPSEILGIKFNGFALDTESNFSSQVKEIIMYSVGDISVREINELRKHTSENNNYIIRFYPVELSYESDLYSFLDKFAEDAKKGNFTISESSTFFYPIIGGIADPNNKEITLPDGKEGKFFVDSQIRHSLRISEDFFQNSDCKDITINTALKYQQDDSKILEGLRTAANKKLSEAKESMSSEEFEEFKKNFKVTVKGALGKTDWLRHYKDLGPSSDYRTYLYANTYQLDGIATFTVNENGELSTNWASKQECEERQQKVIITVNNEVNNSNFNDSIFSSTKVNETSAATKGKDVVDGKAQYKDPFLIATGCFQSLKEIKNEDCKTLTDPPKLNNKQPRIKH